MIRFLYAFVLLALAQPLWSSSISGENGTYAGVTIEFYQQADPFTGEDSLLAAAVVDSNGHFSADLNITETTYVYAKPGIYLLYLFVEPGKNYEVIMPDYKAKTRGDLLNPFFEPENVHLGTKEFNESDLNIQIRMFLNAYIPYYNKHLDKVFTTQEFDQLDKDIKSMEKPFAKSTNTYFNTYREYKYGMLRFLAYQHKSKAISDKYFKGRKVLYKNPAYMELFNMVYKGYFEHFSRADKDKVLLKSIRSDGDYSEMRAALQSDSVLAPVELVDMVALKCLYDEFYDDNYSRRAMLSLIDSFIETEPSAIEIGIAKRIRNKVTRLMVGFAPPKFKLYDKDSNLVSLDTFKGKFVYLSFCSCFSYSCLNEFVLLERMQKKYSKYLDIVTIVIDDDLNVVKEFLEQSGYSWTFLHYDNQPEVLEQYDIRTFPTYYLIDNEGKLSMSPAVSPNDAFEARLFQKLRSAGVL